MQPGVFVRPTIPYDYLFNPYATSLVEATLLASHAPNFMLREAQSIEFFASSTPEIGLISAFMNQHLGPVGRSVAVIGQLAGMVGMGGEIASELGSLGTEVDEFLPPALGGALGGEGSAVSGIVGKATLQDVADLLQELEESGVEVISVKDAREWTSKEIAATIEYGRVYAKTASYDAKLAPLRAGDAFSGELGAASGGTTGPDRIMFDYVNEVKTSAGHPEVGDFINALDQAEGHAIKGNYDGFTATIYDVLNGIKYFVQWRQ
jgi:hypothetical protein